MSVSEITRVVDGGFTKSTGEVIDFGHDEATVTGGYLTCDAGTFEAN